MIKQLIYVIKNIWTILSDNKNKKIPELISLKETLKENIKKQYH